MACACAGIVIGCDHASPGWASSSRRSSSALAQNSLLLALVLTAMAGIVLGMGMPTTPAYIVMVSLLVPALIKLGVVTPAAHMFAFYFAILSAITPPVALAVFAAAGLAKADMWESGWAAMRIGAAGFIVPFMFVYEPALLMIGAWTRDAAGRSLTATIGCICLAAGLFGYLLRAARAVAARGAGRRRAAADQAGHHHRHRRSGRCWRSCWSTSWCSAAMNPGAMQSRSPRTDLTIICSSGGRASAARHSLPEDTAMSNIGFVGLGIMGKPMALNLIKGGHTLFLIRAAACRRNSPTPAAKPAPAPRKSRSKPTSSSPWSRTRPTSKKCCSAPNGVAEGLSKGKTVVDMSSISPIETKTIRQENQ